MVNIRYSKGNLTIKDLSEEYGVSTRTIYRKLTKSYKEELPGLLIRPVVVLMDVTYWGRNFGVVIMKDSLSGNVLWYKFINRHERLEDYKEGIIYLDSLGYTIQAIVCDGFKGLRQSFPNYKFQLCQFHQVMTIKTKLTSRPKLEASKELLAISRMLPYRQRFFYRGFRRVVH